MAKKSKSSESVLVVIFVKVFLGAILGGLVFLSMWIYNFWDFSLEIQIAISVAVAVLFAVFGKDFLGWFWNIDDWL